MSASVKYRIRIPAVKKNVIRLKVFHRYLKEASKTIKARIENEIDRITETDLYPLRSSSA
jgi:hypothetical protein